MAEQKPSATAKVTWLQCQLSRGEWDTLNERRLKLNLKWADIIVPATREYISKLEGKKAPAKRATDTTKEALATPVMEKARDKKADASKSMKAAETKAANPN